MTRTPTYQITAIHRKSILTDQFLFEGVVCYVSYFSYPYHVFLIENGIEIKKKYCKSLTGARRVCKKILQDACRARGGL